MKTLIKIIFIVLATQNAGAAEWSIFGKQVPVDAPITATVPVGSTVADGIVGSITCGLTLEGVCATGATFRSDNCGVSSGIAIFAPLEGGSTVRPRLYGIAYTALRIKVLSVDVEKGLARLEVSQFWPYPGNVQIEGAK